LLWCSCATTLRDIVSRGLIIGARKRITGPSMKPSEMAVRAIFDFCRPRASARRDWIAGRSREI